MSWSSLDSTSLTCASHLGHKYSRLMKRAFMIFSVCKQHPHVMKPSFNSVHAGLMHCAQWQCQAACLSKALQSQSQMQPCGLAMPGACMHSSKSKRL